MGERVGVIASVYVEWGWESTMGGRRKSNNERTRWRLAFHVGFDLICSFACAFLLSPLLPTFDSARAAPKKTVPKKEKHTELKGRKVTYNEDGGGP